MRSGSSSVARSAADHLKDVREAIRAIEGYTKGGKPAFQRSAMMRDAVAARLIQIGQAVKDAQADGVDLQKLQPAIPWRSIAGMRDRLAHKYSLLDTALVWAVVERDLPRLRTAVETLLNQR
jgi:uncharacterized protein with HEPN domain